MKGLGVILIILGGAGLVYALRMDTTVTVPGLSETVHNIGLMDQRRNVLIVSGLVLLGGFIFTGMAGMASQSRVARTIAPDDEAEERFIPEKRKAPPAPKAEDDESDGARGGTILLVASVGLGAFLLALWVFTHL